MELQELFRQLSVSEFSNIPLGEKGAGTIRESDRDAVVVHTNDALLMLHTRFRLREKVLLIEEIEDKTLYRISKDHAQSNPAGIPPQFIVDSVEAPYEGDYIRPLTVTDSENQRYTINKSWSDFSVFTPEPDVIQIPKPVAGRTMAIVYQAGPAKVIEDTDELVDVPDALIPALRHYIAYLVYSNMNSQQNLALGQIHLSRYEEHCMRLENESFFNTDFIATNQNFKNNGWV